MTRQITNAKRSQALTVGPGFPVPAIIARTGKKGMRRFAEFFTAQLPNVNTRDSYGRAVAQFIVWLEAHGATDLAAVQPSHIAHYVKFLGSERRLHPTRGTPQPLGPPSIKQHLAAVRMLLDYLVTGGVLEFNPAAPVKGPKHSTKKGKTPVLTADQCRALFEAIPTGTVVGLRDRALIAVMVYSFARVSAVVNMRVRDFYNVGTRWTFRLHEKGGKFHEVPSHHKAAEFVHAYLEAGSIAEDRKGPLFRVVDRGGLLTPRPLTRFDALKMIKRRALAGGLPPEICNHSFRATGITDYLTNGGDLKKAADIAAHESTRTTKLYDRTDDALDLDEIERIAI